MADKTLEIVIKARDMATGAFKQAAAGLKDLRENALAVGKGGGLENSAKTIGDIGKLVAVTQGLKGAMQGVEAAASGVGMAIAMWQGDAESAGKAMAQFESQMRALPFGIGQAFGIGQSARGLVEKWVFGRKTPEEIRAEMEAAERQVAKMQARIAESAKMIERTQGVIQSLAKEHVLSGFSGIERQAEEAFQKYLERMKDAEKRLTDGLIKSGNRSQQEKIRDQYEIEKRLIEDLFQRSQRDYEKAARERQKSEDDAAAQAQKAEEDRRARQQEEERRHLDEIENIRHQARQIELANQGKTFQARREAVEADHARRLRDAKSQAEREALEILRGQRLSQIQIDEKREMDRNTKETEKGVSPERITGAVAAMELSRQFTGQVARFNAARDPVAENTAATNSKLDDQTKLMVQINEGIRQLAGNATSRIFGMTTQSGIPLGMGV